MEDLKRVEIEKSGRDGKRRKCLLFFESKKMKRETEKNTSVLDEEMQRKGIRVNWKEILLE